MPDNPRENPGATRIPRATYRLQFNAQFTFHHALAIVPYLHELGISDLYASPLFQARAGSTHGYDVCDYNRLNPALGTETDFDALVAALRERGMGLLLDVVPNHMGIGDPANRWWMDVLEFGPASAFARFFDIDWDSPQPDLKGKVLLPILGNHFGRVWERGELKVVWERDAFWVAYDEHRLPVSPAGFGLLLSHLLEHASLDLTARAELAKLLDDSRKAETSGTVAPLEVLKRRLTKLVQSLPEVEEALKAMLIGLNGRPADPRSFDRLQAFLDAQHYRLAFWRVGPHELNYRRFFDITDLVGVRMEDPVVFEAAHRLLLRLLAEGKVTGVRVDHPDGLRDPAGYFRRLQDSCTRGTGVPPVGLGRDGQATAFSTYNPYQPVHRRAGAFLPHWTQQGATYAVCFRLADSLPRHVLDSWIKERDDILRRAREQGREPSAAERERLDRLHSARVETYLDAGHGACWLRQEPIADLVQDALRHFDGQRYRLAAWCVMPNHVHVVVQPLPGHRLPDLLHSWKSFTAKEANKRLARTGEFWQPESYDHLVRDVADFEQQVRHVLDNPAKAGLRGWRWLGRAPNLLPHLCAAGAAPDKGLGRDGQATQRGTGVPPVGLGQDGQATLPLYVVAEKILSEGEALPPDWPVAGTTGYDFLNELNALFVNAANAESFTRLYADFIGDQLDFRDVVNSRKKLILQKSLAGETQALVRRLKALAAKHRHGRDFTSVQLELALVEIMAALPVYRTYLTEESESPSPADRRFLAQALAEAERRSPALGVEVFNFVGGLLTLENLQEFAPADRGEVLEFILRCQQLSGPAAAKGVEDTAFYVYNRLLSLNEVGGDPARFGGSVADFHRQNLERRDHWPHSLLATATHDTKRGEDVRARLNVLSEIPDEWAAALARWRRFNADKKMAVDGQPAPDANDEYLCYQTLLGVWPAELGPMSDLSGLRERVRNYWLKAAKEAKRHTSWVDPDADYETALSSFADRVLDGAESRSFLEDFLAFQQRVAYFGQFNSLSQVLLKLTAPGVPDFYQGTELWDLSLVDPDNRRPVDFGQRQRWLDEARQRMAEGQRLAWIRELVQTSQHGRIKLFLTHLGLRFRQEHHELFAEGEHVPLRITGSREEHLCAFARVRGERAAIIAVPRLVYGLTAGEPRPPVGHALWQDTQLELAAEVPGRSFRNVFTLETIVAAEAGQTRQLGVGSILSEFPVALLERVE